MAQNTVVLGTPNAGDGDPIRDAFDKVNQNFGEMYSSFIATGTITVGNSTVNTVISNTSGLRVGNTTSNSVVNSSSISIGNSTVNSTINSSSVVVGNISLNTTAVFIGNSITNSAYLVNSLKISNTLVSSELAISGLNLGNSTVNTTINSSEIKVTSANVVSNIGLTLGSSTDAANGYTFLPNGFKINWGWVSANDSSGTVLFTPNFATNAYSVTATSNSTGTYQAAVISWDKTSAQIRTANQTSTNVHWMAIGK